MNLSLLIMEFLPLLIYLIVDVWKGFRAGILAAMLCTLLMVGYHFFMFGEFDKFLLGEGLMILVLGSVSLKMNNDKYFKFQPTVLAWIFSGVFAWFQVFDQPLLLHFIPHMEKLLESSPGELRARDPEEPAGAVVQESEMQSLLRSAKFKNDLARMSGAMIWLFLAHGLIMTYAALRLRTSGWFAWRLAIYPALFLLVVISQVLS